jgi:4-hydroxy-3-polyprenylbenzoate decarboxylase
MSTAVAHRSLDHEPRDEATFKPEPRSKSGPIYRDIREYLAELDRRELLIHVKRLMNKDTEVMPLVRWQFRGLDQSQRKGWLFENLTDSRGRKFDGSVAVGIGGASPQVYAAAMGLESPKGVGAKWLSAMTNPIEPVEVARDRAPVKEVVINGSDIVKSGGIDQFPVTVTNPGTDVSAYFSAPIWITRDPKTGVYNAGTYRVMVKAADRAGVMMLTGQKSRLHWEKARALGRPLEAVLCLSVVPAITRSTSISTSPSGATITSSANGMFACRRHRPRSRRRKTRRRRPRLRQQRTTTLR